VKQRQRRYLKPYKVFYTRPDGRTVVRGRDGSKTYWYRILMQNVVGRELDPREHVHHVNGDHTDDRLENLALVHESEHPRIHGDIARSKRGPCSECGAERQNEARCVSRTLCQRCYDRSEARAGARRDFYRRNRERILAQKNARRAWQRANGMRVT
jgi:hypothetical protein